MMALCLFLAVLAALAGMLIFGIASAMDRVDRLRREHASVRADARIVEELSGSRPDSREPPRFVYEFPVDGIPRRVRHSGNRRWRTGDVVSVCYDPRCPENLYILESEGRTVRRALYVFGGVWMLIAAALAIYGVLGVQ